MGHWRYHNKASSDRQEIGLGGWYSAAFVRLSPKCRPCRGFLVMTDFVSHGFRLGLRCVVPPGLPGLRNQVATGCAEAGRFEGAFVMNSI